MVEVDRIQSLNWLLPTDWQLKTERYPDLMESLFAARGLEDEKERKDIYKPESIQEHDPFLFRDMERACKIIDDLIAQGRTDFMVFGDYDVDGLCASAILARYFRSLGIKSRVLIPDRLTDGYGLDDVQVDRILHDPPDLLITVDSGSNAVEEVKELLANDVQVIVSDHHQPLVDIDRSLCPYINPVFPDETYPFPHLAGAAVAYKFVEAMASFRSPKQGDMATLLVLAGIATVADIMPLQDENRLIVWAATKLFNKAAPLGLLCLAERGRRSIDTQLFSFYLGPRLNAAGRMGKVYLALELLLSEEIKLTERLCSELESLNMQRKDIENDIYQEAKYQVISNNFGRKPKIVFAYGSDWHLGVLGIVANKLVEEFRCPAIVLSKDEHILKGSGRSYGSFNLLLALEAAEEFLLQYGGHSKACGLQVATNDLVNFKKALEKYVSDNVHRLDKQVLQADCLLDINELDIELVEALKVFEPTGNSNPKPSFILKNVRIEEIAKVGHSGDHLRLKVSDGLTQSSFLNMIAFQQGSDYNYYEVGDWIDVLGLPEINEYMNRRNVQLRVTAIRIGAEKQRNEESIAKWKRFLQDKKSKNKLNERQPIAAKDKLSIEIFPRLWPLLEILAGQDKEDIIFAPSRMVRLLRQGYNIDISEFALLVALTILTEAHLIDLFLEEDGLSLTIRAGQSQDKKPKLRQTESWKFMQQCGGIKK